MSKPPSSDTAVIVDAVLSAGHDGAAEAVIRLRHPNGAINSVTFNCAALETALDTNGITSLDQLAGLPWTVLVRPTKLGDNDLSAPANATTTAPFPEQ